MSGEDGVRVTDVPLEVDVLVIQFLCLMLPLLMAMAISFDHFA